MLDLGKTAIQYILLHYSKKIPIRICRMRNFLFMISEHFQDVHRSEMGIWIMPEAVILIIIPRRLDVAYQCKKYRAIARNVHKSRPNKQQDIAIGFPWDLIFFVLTFIILFYSNKKNRQVALKP